VKRVVAIAVLAVLTAFPILASAQADPAPAPAAPAVAPAPAVQAPPQLDVPLFPLAQLKAGFKGTGYTVIRGTEIKPFNVEVLELVPKGGFDGGPMVLARFSGETIEFSDGIAGGYSGSPVYIDGKLLGAVSMAMPFTDTHIGGITPIQSMLAALPDGEPADVSSNTVLPPTQSNGKPLDEEGNEIEVTQVSYFDQYDDALAYNTRMRQTGQRRYGAVLCKTPVFFSGLSPQVREAFAPKLAGIFGDSFQLIEQPMGSAGDMGLFLQQADNTPGLLLQTKTTTPPALVGGDAIAVSLVTGDVEMYAVGTMTYSDSKGRFLCFGHPMMASGDANYPIGKAYVTWTHKSIQRAFKEGVRLTSAGTMTKDKSAACGGRLGQAPDMIPVRVTIKDIDRGIRVSKKFDVIRNADFTPTLIAMGMSQVATEALDRQPGGTMKLSYDIRGEGLKEPLRRTNYYSDETNVVMSSAYDIVPISNLLETNIYRDVKVTKVELLLEITRNRTNASIDDADIINKDLYKQEAAAAAAAAAGVEGVTPPAEAAPGSPDAKPAPEPKEEEPSRPTGVQRWMKRRLQEQDPNAPQSPDDATTAAPGAMQVGMVPNMGAILPTFKPGDVIRVKVRLQPYRTDAVWREFNVKVPDDFPAGNTMVIVHGGGDLISPSELNGKGRSLFSMGPIIDLEAHDLDSVLEQILDWPINNELLVTLVRPYDPAQATQLGTSPSAGPEAEKPDDKIDAKYQMEWVIYNGFMLPINIITEEQQSALASMPGTPIEEPNGITAPTDPNSKPPEEDKDNDDGDDGGDSGDDTELPY
jgi:hypothetical protein